MPRNDGTGPAGMGAMTGRGMGLCQGGFGRNVLGGRLGLGFRRGRRIRGIGIRFSNANIALVSNKAVLERQKLRLETMLEEVKKILGDMEQKQNKEEESTGS